MPKSIDLSNVTTYLFYALLLAGTYFAQIHGQVPNDTLITLLGGLGIGHGVGSTTAIARVVRPLVASLAPVAPIRQDVRTVDLSPTMPIEVVPKS